MPKVSIIVPVFNGESYVRRSLETVFKQDFEDYEIIVVDDGSCDETYNIVADLLKRVKSEKFSTKLIHQKNDGVGGARNTGLKVATGKYLVFFDADDLMSSVFLCKLYNLAESSKSEITFCGFDNADGRGKVIENYTDNYSYVHDGTSGPEVALEMLYGRVWLLVSNAIYRADHLQKYSLRFTPGCIYGEDYEFVIKALSLAHSVSCMQEPLMLYVQRRGSIHSSTSSTKLFHLLGVKKRLLCFLQRANAPHQHKELIEARLIPEVFLKTLQTLVKEHTPRRRMKQILANPETTKNLLRVADNDKVKMITSFLIRHFPHFFLRSCVILERMRNH